MEKVKDKIYSLILFSAFNLILIPAYASPPEIYSLSTNSIQQGKNTDILITGRNLNSIVDIGVTGGGVFPFKQSEDPLGTSLKIRFYVYPDALPGERLLNIKNSTGENTTNSINVVQYGAPVIDNVYPNSTKPGKNIFLYLSGKNLNSTTISTSSSDLQINSYNNSANGTILIIYASVSSSALPGRYEIYVNTSQGQAIANLLIQETQDNNYDSAFNPYGSSITSVEINPADGNSVLIKGIKFNPDDSVNLLQNSDGSVISTQLTSTYLSENELLVDLPSNLDVSNTQVSFAVLSKNGDSSNIKPLSYNQQSDNSSGIINPTDYNNSEDKPDINEPKVDTAPDTDQGSVITTNTPPPGTQPSLPTSNPQVDPNSQIVSDSNIQNLTQVLFGQEKKSEDIISLNSINDPEEIIAKIEESKNIKNQTDLINVALKEAEKAKDKNLEEAVKKSELLKSKVEELENLLKEEEQKNKPDLKKLETYKKLLASANAESRSQTFEVLNNLLKYKPQLKNLLIQKPFDLAAIQPNIPSNAAILQYVPTEEGLIIFVVDNKNLKIRINKEISNTKLDKMVKSYRNLLESEIENVSQTGRTTPILSWKKNKSESYNSSIKPLKRKTVALYNVLIKPIENDIVNKNSIAVISNGWLRYLPFQSLGKYDKDGNINYLISNKAIVYLDSVLALSRTKNNPISTNAKIAIFANPDGSLSGAVKESSTINSLFSMSTNSIVGKSFNKNTINTLASESDVLHLATHGVFNSTNVGSSFLVTGKKTNGKNIIIEKLYLKDIYDLNLNNNKLVVLSGCDTGKLGSIEDQPDDIVGSLASAFRVAGANTILASLWQAHDEATNLLMKEFYNNLKSGLNKAESLRMAEIEVKSNPKYSHPIFWSLFSLIGDWR